MFVSLSLTASDKTQPEKMDMGEALIQDLVSILLLLLLLLVAKADTLLPLHCRSKQMPLVLYSDMSCVLCDAKLFH